MFTKCTIHISIQYPATCMEVLSGDTESTEVALEAVISPILMELFGGEIVVDDVTVEQSQSNYQCDDLIYRA
ncbi:MAG: hypothetical protein JOZ18_23220 [Chloroflexi bacterium]|nr:hypothetical protein [Chloroflexota bacterium]